MKTFPIMLLTSLLLLAGCKEGKLRSANMAVCTRTGASEDMCACMWDGVKDHYGLDRLEGIEKTGVFPPDYISVARGVQSACLVKVAHISLEEQQKAGLIPANDSSSSDPDKPPISELLGVSSPPAPTAPSSSPPEVTQPYGLNATSVGDHKFEIYQDRPNGVYILGIDGHELKRFDDAYLVSVKWSSQSGNGSSYALVGISSGGSACPMRYVIAEIQANSSSRLSPEFGSCSDQLGMTGTTGRGVTVSMPGFMGPSESPQDQEAAASKTETYVWQDGALSGP